MNLGVICKLKQFNYILVDFAPLESRTVVQPKNYCFLKVKTLKAYVLCRLIVVDKIRLLNGDDQIICCLIRQLANSNFTI